MTEASRILAELAEKNLVPYLKMPQLQAALLTGSAAEGESDTYSDLDLILYYSALPSEEMLQEARMANGSESRLWLAANRDEGSVMEAYECRGVECQYVHTTVEAWEKNMAVVLEVQEVATPIHKALSGLLYGQPLLGRELIESWKERTAQYPDALQEAMIRHYSQFFPI